MDKKKFLKEDFTKLLASLKSDAKGKWGKMNAQQMVEHMSDAFRTGSGRTPASPVLTAEQTQKAYAFLMSEKPFRENTANPLLGPEPVAVKSAVMSTAIAELQSEIDFFLQSFEGQDGRRVVNPFYGNLNFEEQVRLLHKHAMHHARQFGLVE